MSKFRPGYFDYIKFNRVYYTPVVENVFDLVYKSQFETVKSQVTKGIININTRKSLLLNQLYKFSYKYLKQDSRILNITRSGLKS